MVRSFGKKFSLKNKIKLGISEHPPNTPSSKEKNEKKKRKNNPFFFVSQKVQNLLFRFLKKPSPFSFSLFLFFSFANKEGDDSPEWKVSFFDKKNPLSSGNPLFDSPFLSVTISFDAPLSRSKNGGGLCVPTTTTTKILLKKRQLPKKIILQRS